jgi:hypothetical protein
VEVRSLHVSNKLVQDLPRDAKQENIETDSSGTETKDITVVSSGPVLGHTIRILDSCILEEDFA